MLEPQEGLKTKEIVSLAEYSERSGYGYFFRSDHLLPTSGRRAGVESPDCWVTLAAVAANTRRIKFGPMVSPVGFRNPALLARMACTLHDYSGGRLQLGLGAGWYEPEYAAHGIPFPKFGVRRRELIEALDIIRPLTEGRSVNYDGEYFSAHMECFPKPVGDKIHLILGGRSPKIVQAASEYADECNIFSSPVEVLSNLAEMIHSNGRKLEISQMGPFLIADSDSELHTRIERHMKARAIEGTPEQERKRLGQRGVFCGLIEEFVEQLNRRREIGVQKFYFQVLYPDDKAMMNLLTDTLRTSF